MTYTTLNAIRVHSPCEDSWEKLLKHLHKTKADDAPLSFATILESNGLSDAIWCLRALDDTYLKAIRLFACDMAEHVLPYFTAVFPNDNRPAEAIRVARLFADGRDIKEELRAAVEAAVEAAARAVEAAARAAWAAAEKQYQEGLFVKYFCQED